MSGKNMTTPKYVFKLISYHTAEVLKGTAGVATTQYLRSTYNSSLYGETLPLLWGRKTQLWRSLMTFQEYVNHSCQVSWLPLNSFALRLSLPTEWIFTFQKWLLFFLQCVCLLVEIYNKLLSGSANLSQHRYSLTVFKCLPLKIDQSFGFQLNPVNLQ